MRTMITLLAAAAAFASALPACAGDSLCPDAVSVKQSGAAPTPEWSVSYSALPNRLQMVTFYSGPPKDEASLVYDDLVNASDSSTATWKLPKDARGYWVKCSYAGTTLELSKALPSTVSSCQVVYEPGTASASGLPAIKRSACR